MRDSGKAQTVKCTCGHIEAKATYTVDGRYLVLRSPFGIKRVLLGFAVPKRIAQRLFKNICEREAATQRAEMAEAAVPAAEVIDSVEGPVATAQLGRPTI